MMATRPFSTCLAIFWAFWPSKPALDAPTISTGVPKLPEEIDVKSGSRKEREARQRRQSRQARNRMLLMAASGAAVLVIGLIVVGSLLRGDSGPVTHSAPTEGYILGSSSAPVVITAWEDFQCPVCKAANASTLRVIEDQYVSTGKAQVIFRQFPFLGPESTAAAEASQCAADQIAFWDYHDALFTAQGAENSGVYSKAKLKQIAADLGLDTASFNTCLDSGAHSASVAAEKAEGVDLGVKGTPTFFVNGKRVEDWTDYGAFAALIESALQEVARVE
jgi:protein-disulfide isomerase